MTVDINLAVRRSRITPEAMVNELRTLPSGPRVLPRLLELLGDDNADIQQIVDVILLERSLATRVLQISNSAYYRGDARVVSVQDAVSRLGFNEVRTLVVNAVGADFLGNKLDAYALTGKELWRQAVTAAFGADQLARMLGEDPANAYTLGLMQSVGMVVVNGWMQSVARDFQLSFTGYEEEWTGAEREFLNFTQADAGAALLKQWAFPAAFYEPVRCQYQPLGTGPYQRQSAFLQVSRWFRLAALSDESKTPLPPVATMEWLKLDASGLDEALRIVREQLSKAQGLLEIV